MTTTVVWLDDRRSKPPKRVKQKSQYQLYPLPFFNAKERCSWDIPTGKYSDDCATGRLFAFTFLNSCYGTAGRSALLPQIVADMIRSGTSGQRPDGAPKVNGIVVGFMGGIGSALVDYLEMTKER